MKKRHFVQFLPQIYRKYIANLRYIGFGRLNHRIATSENTVILSAAKNLFFIAILFFFIASVLSAQNAIASENIVKSPHSWTLTTDFAYYPKSAPVVSSKSHFAPLTGIYDGLQFRVTGNYEYTLNDYLKLGAELELSPASIVPHVYCTYNPLPFLVFGAGAKIGTGWEFLGNQGLASYNETSGKYDNIAACFYEFDISGLFQFDAAAVWPGDWHHIVFVASYDFRFSGVTGQSDGHPWCWQAIEAKVNGPNYYAFAILGYQMPKLVSMIGVQAEFFGYYADSQFDKIYNAFNGSFCEVCINPMVQFTFSKKDSLITMLYFKTRRGFDSDSGNELTRNCTGSEWFFQRIAFRYIHKF